MKKLLLMVLLIANSAIAENIDRIIAVVNNEVVLQSELTDMEYTVRQQLRQRGSTIPAASILSEQVLERLIIQKIQVQQAKKIGVRIGDDSLNAALKQIADNNGLSLREFRDVLEADGYDFPEFRESIRQDMIISRLRKSQVEDKIVVSDREVDNYLATQQVQGASEVEYKLQHILISVPEAASPEQVQAAEQKLAVVQELLDSGDAFSDVAAAYSDGQTALEGGDLGWRKQGELPSLFAAVVPSLSEGQVSEPIRNGSGFHLVRLDAMKSAEQHLVKQTLASHILLRTNELVTDEDAEKRLNQLRERVLNGSDFAEIARANSDDTGSAIEGGSLGWTSPGVMVPEFEKKMDELEIGGVSEVFKSRFGWHMIKVFDRREQNMAEEYKRTQARIQIKKRKADENFELWLRQLRDEAYVEYRDR
jgi:peptidyl-prolyl cis-trans isomerase SurA